MSLRTFFGGKDDAVTVFRNKLLDIVKNGNYNELDRVLQTEIEAPPAILGAALQKCAGAGQMRMTTRLLDAGAPLGALSFGTVRGVVLEQNKDFFRLLTDRGLDFSLYISSSSNNSDSTYINRLNYMRKDLECDLLREELAALKSELAILKKEPNAAEDETPHAPRKKDGGNDLRL
ncbi:MAG: hypothetical protein GC185_04660 [Alphaproteobacteria bacterium]|nr:hypothetical protein [Alphaproteobacteria bacterium]